MPVLLISDLLWWLIIFALLWGIHRARKNPQKRQQWLSVFNQPLAMICFCVLLFFVVITCLDSLHWRHSKGTVSLLDVALAPVAQKYEQSYSEPFAVYALNKTNVFSDGVLTRQHPRLLHTAKDIPLPAYAETTALPASVLLDIALRLLQGLLMGSCVALLLLMPLWLWARSQVYWRSQNTCFCTLALLLILTVTCYWLSLDYHVLGTDKVGNDVLSNVIKGTRTAMLIGTLTTVVLLPLAIISGLSAGYFRGVVDDVIQYIYTTVNSIPGILLIASAVLLLQVFMDLNTDFFVDSLQRSDARLVLLCVILGLTSWTGLCRLLRAEALKIRSLEYVQAAQAFGVSNGQILLRHILPNVSHIVLIVVVLDFSGLVLAEAVLAYVGIGVDPITPSWGNMINSARMEIAKYPPIWWSITAVFLLMFSLVLAANLFADAVRKEFDPKYRSLV